ncbi:MAG: hypothetical protein WBD55_05250 [Dehalococcoidia bacterium]
MAANGGEKTEGIDLLIPIYIDTNVLLDLLASLEGGFSIVEKVTTRSASSQESERGARVEGGTEFGILNVLNLLKINVGGSLASKKGHETGEEREAERYHTYGSLLYRLRTTLIQQGLVKQFDRSEDSWQGLQPSDFVELRGVFRPNPLADSLGLMDRLLGLMLMLSEAQLDTTTPTKKAAQSQKGEARQFKQLSQFLKGILADIESNELRLLVIDLPGSPLRTAVVTLFTEYLRDQSMTELAHNEYFLLGKVVRKITDPGSGTIPLLRGTALGGVGDDTLSQLSGALNEIEGMDLPKVETKVNAPALQVVPIAIYV